MKSTRGTIHLTNAEILDHRSFPGDQYILRVRAPKATETATPGSFAHISCDPSISMRRPLSIMRADAEAGWLEFLYKPVGRGLELLSQRTVGERLSVLAPIGNGFSLRGSRPHVLAIGGGVGIPPMIFLAEQLASAEKSGSDPDFLRDFRPLVLMGSEVPFPFELIKPNSDPDYSWPADATMSLRLLEDWGVPSRLASQANLPGAHLGYVPDLARGLLSDRDAVMLSATQIVACGPEPMLHAVAKLAAEFALPCQLALEEFMACGVGGCAGCTVLVHTAQGTAMKRVCVDGPVFEASEIYPRYTESRFGF